MKRFCLFLICLLTGILPVAAQVAIAFSKPGGFYPETFTLSIETENGGDAPLQIRYTLNGAVPTANSLLYKHPLAMDRTLYSSSNFYKIPNTIPKYAVPVPGEVEHIIVVRAAAFNAEGERCSDVITASTSLPRYWAARSNCQFCRCVWIPLICLTRTRAFLCPATRLTRHGPMPRATTT